MLLCFTQMSFKQTPGLDRVNEDLKWRSESEKIDIQNKKINIPSDRYQGILVLRTGKSAQLFFQ